METEKKICGRCKKEKPCKCGRPTDYKEEYCDLMINYFEKCQAEIVVDIKFFNARSPDLLADILNPLADKEDQEHLHAGPVKEIGQKLVMQRFPTFIRFARSIGVNKTTLYEWEKNHKMFSNAMDECRSISEAILLENGLQGTYNPAFAQFLLKNNHGYSDKSTTELTGANGGPVEIDSKQKSAVDTVLGYLGKK